MNRLFRNLLPFLSAVSMGRRATMDSASFRNILSFSLKVSFVRGLLLVLIIFAAVAPPAAAQTCTGGIPNEECDALYALYNGTGGDQWTDNTNWLSAEPVGDWYGIKVDGGNVTEIKLELNALTGSIPPELGNLTNLVYLRLDSNNLTGLIPPELGNLSNLTHLYLNSNNLTGIIPPHLGNLSNLELMYLSHNSLDGDIPSGLGSIGALESLYLNNNGLTGSIPSELGNLANLRSLLLSSNNLAGVIPPSFGGLASLESLYLSDNDLSGEIPYQLGGLTNLKQLSLDRNSLTGEIPAELGSLTSLELLYLYSNSLSGEIPAELGNLTSLVYFDLNANGLSGDLPAFLATPPFYVNLRWNCLYASDPAVLAAMEGKHSNQFMSTQTIPPENVTAETVESSGTEETRVLVSWNPISYVNDDGGYQVYYRRTDSPAEYSDMIITSDEASSQAESDPDNYYYGMTADKNASSLTVSNLAPGVDYTFRVNTVTRAHAFNPNDLQSLDSDTDSAVSGTLSRAFIPVWKQSSEYFTGVVVSNFGDTDFDLNLAAYDSAGALEPLGQNPAGETVKAGLQKSRLGWEFFQGNATHNDLSWIELGAENSNKMGSIFLFGVNDTRLLDGAESQSSYAKKLYFTRPLDEGFFQGWQPDIQMCLVNPTDEEVTVSCWLKGSNGGFRKFHTIPSMGFLAGNVGDLIIPGHGIINGYMDIEVTEGAGVVGFSRIEFPGVRTALGMNAVEQSSAKKMYSAQLAHGSNIVTNLRLVNTASSSQNVTLMAVGDDGSTLADPIQVEIASWRIYSTDLGTLFGLEGEGIITTGSLVVESDGSGVIGDIIFAEGDTLEYAMSLPLQDRLFQEAVFNHISNLPTVFTGFAFYNPGDETAYVFMEAFGTDGLKVAEKTLILAPGERIARTLTDPDIWPGFGEQSGGYIRIRSSQPIAGQQLFGDRALRYMAAVPPTTRVEAMFD